MWQLCWGHLLGERGVLVLGLRVWAVRGLKLLSLLSMRRGLVLVGICKYVRCLRRGQIHGGDGQQRVLELRDGHLRGGERGVELRLVQRRRLCGHDGGERLRGLCCWHLLAGRNLQLHGLRRGDLRCHVPHFNLRFLPHRHLLVVRGERLCGMCWG